MFKHFFKTTLIAAAVVSLVACSSNSAVNNKSTSLTKLRLNEVAHSIFYAPQYVAIEAGYFKEAGIDLELTTGFGADKVMTSLISGEADVGFMGSEASIYTYNQGAKDYAVNFAQLTQRAGNFLVAREPVDNFTWDNVRGRTILGGRAGGMPQMLLEYILRKNNIDPERDVTILQNIDFGSTAAAFSSGLGDFTAEFEPTATTIEMEGRGKVVASMGVDSGFVPYTAYCAKGSWLEAHPELAKGFVTAIQRGLDYVNTHTSEEIAAIIAPQFPETDLTTLANIVERYRTQDTWPETTCFSKDSYELLCDILKSSNQLSTRPPYEALVTTEFSKSAGSK